MAIGLMAACGPGRLIHKGDSYMELGQMASAERTYRKAVQQHPGNAAALLRHARSLLLMDDPDSAIAPARAALEAGLDEALPILVEACLGTGRLEDAQNLIQESLHQDPRDQSLLLLKARLQLARNDLPSAIQTLEQGLDDVLATAEASAFQAWLKARAGISDQAIELARGAMTEYLSANITEPWVQARILGDIASTFHIAGQDQARLEAVSEFRTLKAGDIDRVESRAKHAYRNGDTEAAIRMQAWAAACRPQAGRTLLLLGRLLLEKGENTLALRFLSESITADPFLYDSSFDDARQDDSSRVRRGYHKVSNAELATALKPLAEAFAKTGQPARAASALQQALILEGNEDPSLWLEVGRSWVAGSDYLRAMAVVNRVLTENKRNVPAHLLAVDIATRMNQPTIAINHAQLAWWSDTTRVESALLLGHLLEEQGDLSRARKLYDEALRLHPEEEQLRALRDSLGR